MLMAIDMLGSLGLLHGLCGQVETGSAGCPRPA